MTTVRALLFGGKADEVKAAEKLAASGAVSSPAVCRAVLEKTSQVLDFEVSDVLLEAWRTRSALLDAAHQTHANPGTVRRVTLKTYALPWEHRMEFDVRLNGKQLMTIHAALGLELEVTALVAVVQRGLLTAIEGGVYLVTAALRVQEHELLSRQRQFDLRYELKVGTGIPLIKQARPGS